MAITAKRQGLTESGNGVTFSVDYRVKEDSGDLNQSAAVAAAIAQGQTDYGIEIVDHSFTQVSDSEYSVPLTFSRIQYENYLASSTGGGPGGPFVPAITEDRIARILPPQPVELDFAFEIIQKQPGSYPDRLVLDLRIGAVRNRVPIYPPQENYSTRFTVPQSLMTSDLFFDLSDMAHKLNDAPIIIGGVEWPAQTVMLLSGVMQAPENGAGVLDLSFALGREFDRAWTRVDPDTSAITSETMTDIKPFSHLSYHYELVAGTKSAPAQQRQFGLYEYRVRDLADYSTVFATPPE